MSKPVHSKSRGFLKLQGRQPLQLKGKPLKCLKDSCSQGHLTIFPPLEQLTKCFPLEQRHQPRSHSLKKKPCCLKNLLQQQLSHSRKQQERIECFLNCFQQKKLKQHC